MFVYQNKFNEICVTFQDSKPVDNPEYIITVDEEAKKLLVNGGAKGAYEAVTIDKDVVNKSAETVNSAKRVTIAKGVTVSIPEDTWGQGVYHVVKNGSLVIDGQGTINGVGKNSYNIAIWADGGNVTINGGKFTNIGADDKDDPTHFDLIYASKGSTVIINDGYFECQTPKWTLNLQDDNPGKIIVRGGTFVDFDPSNADTEVTKPYSFVDKGYKVVQTGNLYKVVKA